ncbi:MAG: RnfABCDGE type electron transport complex subunit G [Clostridia bacterium]|nr:RnfABCDGE type electron transport complex subunit G [Clostridia bacterium]
MADISPKKVKGILLPAAILLAICIIISLALSLTNRVTAQRISELEARNQRETMGNLVKASDYEHHTKTYESKDGEQISFDYDTAVENGETIAYIFVTASKGYGGTVSVMTAVDPQGTVQSVAILDVSNETPGLGQNAAKENFYRQFSGKTAGISLLKNGAQEDQNEINAVTGATITSTAVTRAVNEALDQFEAIKEDSNDVEK